jgi:flagellar biosynthetic protein FliR
VGAGLEQVIAQAVFVGVRVGMLMVFAPFFGGLGIPARVKLGLTIALTALLYPVYAPRSIDLSNLDWCRVVGGEVIVGLLLGLTLTFVIEGAQLAGQILGFQLGYSLVNVIDPQTQVDTPVLSIFHQSIVVLLFLQLGVHHWLLRGLAKSFEYLPPGVATATPAATEGLIHAAGAMLVIAVQIAAPALSATLLADIILGLIGKASAQLPVLFIGLSVKALVGFLVLMGSLRYWPVLMDRYFLRALQTAEHLLHLAR